MMIKKFVIAFFLLSLTFRLWLHCESQKKPIPWNPALNENTVYVLKTPITETKKQFEALREFQKKGQKAKATEAMKQIQLNLEKLELYYVPLLNAKAHISAAHKLYLRKEHLKAEEQLKKARSQIKLLKPKISDVKIKEVNDIIFNLESLEKEMRKVTNTTEDRFIKSAERIEKLIIEAK